ncbi:MAG: hypothetical protein KatS3mg034_1421 [Vicingaceae bacterium]|nr:MAG: hypothetical protein KatS3mg034_1421 [Vicingaceae bacterium]
MTKHIHNIKKIFSPGRCLTPEEIEKLLSNQCSDVELNKIQHHLSVCPLCKDAVIGLKNHPGWKKDLEQIQQEIRHKFKIQKIKKLALFSSLGILMIISLFPVFQHFKINPPQKQKDLISYDSIEHFQTEPINQHVDINSSLPDLAVEKDNNIAESDKNFTTTIQDDNRQESTHPVNDSIELQPMQNLPVPLDELNNFSYNTESISSDWKNKYQNHFPFLKLDFIGKYKIIDYTDQYLQEAYDRYLKERLLENNSPDDSLLFSFEDFSVNRKMQYKEVLSNAIKEMDNQRYLAAQEFFSAILDKHPGDLNAWFYGGLNQYKNKNYRLAEKYFLKVLNSPIPFFYQEAEWYYALCLLKQGKTENARKIFQEIAKNKGFYSEPARQMLNQMD